MRALGGFGSLGVSWGFYCPETFPCSRAGPRATPLCGGLCPPITGCLELLVTPGFFQNFPPFSSKQGEQNGGCKSLQQVLNRENYPGVKELGS